MHSIVPKKNITFLYKLLIADRANINTRIIILKPERKSIIVSMQGYL